MFGEQQVRTLLGPADPVRNTAVAPPRLSAYDIIARAEATAEPVAARRSVRPTRRNVRPTRRLVLTAGAVAVAAAATAVISKASTVDEPRTTPPPDALGSVLVPISYEFPTTAQPAGPQLRALASRIGDAPYENHTGRYTYHHFRSWDDGGLTSADGHSVSLSEEWKIWEAADGSAKQVTIFHEPQYPDQESRDYWQRVLRATPIPALDPNSGPHTDNLPPSFPDIAPLPSDRAGLSGMLKVEFGGGAVSKEVGTVYGRYAVPRRARAEILRILADVPGFLWRGEVTDRAGRKGVAVTFDDREHDMQSLLIFNPTT
ncbi:MAG TPA: CU044_5270 family protein, partial [Micromonosporaceae bacterium]